MGPRTAPVKSDRPFSFPGGEWGGKSAFMLAPHWLTTGLVLTGVLSGLTVKIARAADEDEDRPKPEAIQYSQDGRKVDGQAADARVAKTIPQWIEQAKTARSNERRQAVMRTLLAIGGDDDEIRIGRRDLAAENEEVPLVAEMAALFGRFIAEKDEQSRYLALRGVILTGVDRNLQSVIRMTDDPYHGQIAVEALGRSKDARAIGALQKLLESWRTRERPLNVVQCAARSLGEIGTDKAKTALEASRKKLSRERKNESVIEAIDRELDRIEGN